MMVPEKPSFASGIQINESPIFDFKLTMAVPCECHLIENILLIGLQVTQSHLNKMAVSCIYGLLLALRELNNFSPPSETRRGGRADCREIVSLLT